MARTLVVQVEIEVSSFDENECSSLCNYLRDTIDGEQSCSLFSEELHSPFYRCKKCIDAGAVDKEG